jgi:hypothetical protein
MGGLLFVINHERRQYICVGPPGSMPILGTIKLAIQKFGWNRRDEIEVTTSSHRMEPLPISWRDVKWPLWLEKLEDPSDEE